MNPAVQPYLKRVRLRVFEYDPGLIRLRRAGRIILGGVVSLLPALIISILFGVERGLPPGTIPHPDLTLIFPVLIISVLFSANIAGATTRDRKLGMARNFFGGILVSLPASLVAEGSLPYGASFAALAFFALYLRKLGASWKGTGPIALTVFVLVPRLDISPDLLPRFWLALAAAFLSAFYVSFHILPIRLTRALLDCLARFIAAASSSVYLLLPRSDNRSGQVRIKKAKREMDDSLALWYEIAAGVLPPKDPAWAILDGVADGQFRLGNLLRIAGGSLADITAGAAAATRRRAEEVLEELESVLETARRTVVMEGRVEFELTGFREKIRRFQEDWEAGRTPLSALDIQIGKFAAAMERTAGVLETISAKARRLTGREE